MIKGKNIQDLFSDKARKEPHHAAVHHRKRTISYQTLETASQDLAATLKKDYAPPGSIMGISMQPGINAVIAMLAVLKAGHGFLFLDPADPPRRSEGIIDTAKPLAILTDSADFRDTNENSIDVTAVYNRVPPPRDTLLYKTPPVPTGGGTAPEPSWETATAYVVFTSGSTGNPKGIPISHGALINLFEDFQCRCALNGKDRCALWSSLNFDVSIYEIWSPLLTGGTLFIPDPQVRMDADKYIHWLEKEKITSGYIPPFMVAPLAARQKENPIPFKRLLTGVEPIPERALCTIKANTPGLCLINGYGPSEAAICATLYTVPEIPESQGNAPIGTPVNNLDIYILDPDGTPVKQGEKGEIYIAGVQVSRGYLGKDALSKNHFINDPFHPDESRQMYRTGDLGTRLPSGNIMFGGRKDFQIKLRGFRIEPGEIENVINEYPGVSQSAVVLKTAKSQRKMLTAYVDAAVEEKSLMAFLKSRLPRYMLPSAIILLEKMPRTDRDKIDKESLIKRDDLKISDKSLPQTPLEKQLAEIWALFIDVNPIYRSDDYLHLGGDSITGAKILSRANALFGGNVDIHTFFKHSQLKEFAALFMEQKTPAIHGDTSKENPSTMGHEIPHKTHIPLLEDQYLIWKFEQINRGTPIYHLPFVHRLNGPLNLDMLQRAIEIIAVRHAALQSVFEIYNDIPIQKKVSQTLHQKRDAATGNDDDKWLLDKITRPFDLEKGPLFRTDILVTGEKSYLLCFTFHHIIFDGWSADLFFRELNTTYRALFNEDYKASPPAGICFHRHAVKTDAQLPAHWKNARPFFTRYLKDLPSNSFPAPSRPTAGNRFPIKISEEIWLGIKRLALEKSTTPFTVLLSFFQILLFSETGQNDQITGVAHACRNSVETESTIGFLMNTLVVRNMINIDSRFIDFLEQVKETVEEIYNYSHIPFHKVNKLCQELNTRRSVFDALFLMQTMGYPVLDLEGTVSEHVHPDTKKANCDITLELFEKGNGLNGWLEYRTDIFSLKRIEEMTERFHQIIQSTIKYPGVRINDLLHLNSFPLSPMQHGMLMETLRSPQGAGFYIEQVVFKIDQEIDIERFRHAWQRIIEHHEVLRLGFLWKNMDQPLQYVAPAGYPDIEINDWSNVSQTETDAYLEMFLKADRRLGFALSTPPVFRIALIKTDEKKYACVWSFHHAVADGRSIISILKDLFSLYHAPDALLKPSGDFRDYIVWLNRKQLNSGTEAFWKQKLKGFSAPLELPFTLQKKNVVENRRQEYSIALTTGNRQIHIPPDRTVELKAFCDQNDITMNTMLMGAWAVLLSHYTGKKDIVFGTTRSVRNWRQRESEDTGLYINTLPVRISIDPWENISIFLKRVRSEWVLLKSFEHTSLAELHSWSALKGSDPLFDIFFAYDYYGMDTALKRYKNIISCTGVELFERTPASLFLTVHGLDALTVVLEYDRRRFDTAVIDQMLSHFNTFLKSIPLSHDPCLMEMPILSQSQRKAIDLRLNTDTAHTRPDSCIHHLIEIQASLDADSIAVVEKKKRLTYESLNTYASRIAHYMIQRGAAPEQKVMVLLDQDIDLIAVLLGVLKSGAAYIPVDPDYPDERVRYIIDDAEPEIIITTIDQEDRVQTEKSTVVLLDIERDAINRMPGHNPRTDVTPANMAYIIYTSGSTGNPKGVMVEHSSLVAFTRSAAEVYEIRPDDRMLQFASISFDASAEEIYPTLFSGATLVMKPRNVIHTPSQFYDFCRDQDLTILDLPTSYWHMLADEVDTLTPPERIRLIIIGGDDANGDKVQKWNRHVDANIRLLNTYGPTETTVAVTWADLASSDARAAKGKVSIGEPFSTVNLCILNHFQQPALVGTRGELYIGGAQIGRGYLNRNEQTSNAFVKLPGFNPTTTFFKTGDRVEMTKNGGILFHGRVDRQIKIRGFRVEPGEIERTALGHSAVSQCAVAVSKKEDGTVITAAFIVVRQADRDNFDIAVFKSWLGTKLPQYMIPSLIHVAENLPHTPSGKIDYPALEIPSSVDALSETTETHDFSSPHESKLKDIWEEILGIEVTRTNESFFDVGGSSLYAIKLVSAIEKKFNITIPIIAVFKTPTIEKLAEKIEREVQLSGLKTRRLISGKGNKTPIILVGNSVGSAQAYKNADLKDHPFYHAPIFIHFYSAEQNTTRNLDVWQLARKCIEDINLLFPSGPYIIMGECLNAVVAHEMACQLINMNKTVELLVILDENWDKREIPSTVNKNKNGRMHFLKRQYNEIKESGMSGLFAKILKRSWGTTRRQIHRMDNLRERVNTRLGKPVPEAVQFRLMENVFYKACADNPYVPIPYHGRVLLFDSKGWVEKYSPQLRTLYKGEVVKKNVETTHSEWFKAEQIKTIIDAIDDL